MPPTSSGPTARIAERVVNTRFEELSTETITVTKQCLLDIIGVTLAGTGEPVIRILLDEVEDQGVRYELPDAGSQLATLTPSSSTAALADGLPRSVAEL